MQGLVKMMGGRVRTFYCAGRDPQLQKSWEILESGCLCKVTWVWQRCETRPRFTSFQLLEFGDLGGEGVGFASCKFAGWPGSLRLTSRRMCLEKYIYVYNIHTYIYMYMHMYIYIYM